MQNPIVKSTPAAWPIILAIAILLAGCTAADNDEIDMEAFQAALDAPGTTYTPDEVSGGTDFVVKLLQPVDPEDVPTQNRPFELLLYDDGTEETPVVDVDLRIEQAWMPNHGHACGDYRHPDHRAGGVYEGRLWVVMEGRCDVTLEGSRPDGDSFRLVIELQAR